MGGEICVHLILLLHALRLNARARLRMRALALNCRLRVTRLRDEMQSADNEPAMSTHMDATVMGVFNDIQRQTAAGSHANNDKGAK